MSPDITIIDRGRGPQLSTCRITVLDLVPYFQRNDGDDEITRWIPMLSPQEIAAARHYYHEHREELDERDRQARRRREEQIRQQRESFPEVNGTPEERRERLYRLLEKRRGEKKA